MSTAGVGLPWRAGVAVAACYAYFLVFAQFGLLWLVEKAGVTPETIRGLMAAMGLGGVAGAVVGARVFAVGKWGAQLRMAFALCAVAAAGATWAREAWVFGAVFGVVGLSLGALTVLLAAGLAGAVGRGSLGWCLGAGTGAAYALANVPWIFLGAPERQAWLASVSAGAAAWLAGGMKSAASAVALEGEYSRGGIARWVLALSALVGADSAVFYVVMHTEELRAPTWGNAAGLWGNAAVHLGAALAAGWMLDRGWRRAPVVAGIALIAGASVMLAGWGGAGALAQWLYSAGVSCYSVALVFYPANSGRAGVAAWVYGVAGWGGSAVGIGLAQGRSEVPLVIVAVAGGLVAAMMMRKDQARG